MPDGVALNRFLSISRANTFFASFLIGFTLKIREIYELKEAQTLLKKRIGSFLVN